jgi:hypothetical protein
LFFTVGLSAAETLMDSDAELTDGLPSTRNRRTTAQDVSGFTGLNSGTMVGFQASGVGYLIWWLWFVALAMGMFNLNWLEQPCWVCAKASCAATKTTVVNRLNSAPLRSHRCGCEFRKSLDGAISETGKNRG